MNGLGSRNVRVQALSVAALLWILSPLAAMAQSDPGYAPDNNDYPANNNDYGQAPDPSQGQQAYNPGAGGDNSAGQGSDQAASSYSDAVQQAAVAYNQGNIARCIQLYESARSLSKSAGLPDSSTLALYNNLAAAYIRRGNDSIRKQHNNTGALGDFRKAYFLLNEGLPEGISLDNTTRNNQRIAKSNLLLVSQNLKLPSAAAGLLKQAKALRLQGQFEPAIVEFDRAAQAVKTLAEAGIKREAYQAIGDIFNVLAMPEKSQRYLGLAANGARGSGGAQQVDLLLQLANSQNRSGQVDQSVATLNKALALSPNNRVALGQLEGIWRRELQYNPGNTVAIANLAGVLQKQGRFPEALAAYQGAEQAAAQDPKIDLNSRILLRLNQGTLQQQMQHYREALAIYDSVLKANPNHPQASYYKATLYKQAGQTQDAIELYTRVLGIDPQNTQARRELLACITEPSASANSTTIRPQDAAQVANNLRGVADHFPQDAGIQGAIGEAFHRRGDLPSAITYYQRALSLNPNLASAHANLATALASQGDTSRAGAEASKALALEPNNPTYKQLARQMKGGNENSSTGSSFGGGKTVASKAPAVENTGAGLAFYDEAIAKQTAGAGDEALGLFQKAVDAEPKNRVYWSGYAIALQSENKPDEALKAYQKSLPPAPGTSASDAAPIYYGYGTILQQKGRLPEALSQFQQAVKLDNQYRDAFYALGIVQEKLKRPSEAKASFSRFVKLAEANPSTVTAEDKPLVQYAKSRIASR